MVLNTGRRKYDTGSEIAPLTSATNNARTVERRNETLRATTAQAPKIAMKIVSPATANIIRSFKRVGFHLNFVANSGCKRNCS